MRIEVIKVGEYDPTFNGTFERFEGLTMSASNRTDPPLTSNASVKLHEVAKSLEGTILFHSTTQRGIQTAEIIQKITHVPIFPNPNLNEVPFLLTDLVTRDEYEKTKSVYVREGFVKSFNRDELLESRSSILKRVNNLIDLLDTTDNPAVTLISHSFLMKILEATLAGENLEENPELLAEWIRPLESTYHFGEGFTIDYQNTK